VVLEPLLISGIYQQRYINRGPKTISDGILKSLLMTFSVVVVGAACVALERERHGTELKLDMTNTSSRNE
jgi:hypothetical protein